MKRTITLEDDYAVYGNRKIGYLVSNIRLCFGLKNNRKYKIIIVEGTEFSICKDSRDYTIWDKNQYLGMICRKKFEKLFFTFDVNKKYDIIVEEIEE